MSDPREQAIKKRALPLGPMGNRPSYRLLTDDLGG
jgi:hypothetical protein